MIKVKFCGLKTKEDILIAARAGVYAVGFVLVEKSPRYVDVDTAHTLSQYAKKLGVQSVVLLANQDADFVKQVISTCQPDFIQFHGQESAAFCEQFRYAYWKAVPMLDTNDYLTYCKAYKHATAFLLDTYGQAHTGGSGQAFDWFEFPQAHRDQLILAGGLTVHNVALALKKTAAEFIDISSGIEEMKGVKSADKMQAFMQQVKAFEDDFRIKTSLNP